MPNLGAGWLAGARNMCEFLMGLWSLSCAHSCCNATSSCSQKGLAQTLVPQAATQVLLHSHTVSLLPLAPQGGTSPSGREDPPTNLSDSDFHDKKVVLLLICNSGLISYMKRNCSVVKCWWCLRSKEEPLMLIVCFQAQEWAMNPTRRGIQGW